MSYIPPYHPDQQEESIPPFNLSQIPDETLDHPSPEGIIPVSLSDYFPLSLSFVSPTDGSVFHWLSHLSRADDTLIGRPLMTHALLVTRSER